MTEYEFTLPDGSKRHEICDGSNDMHAFMRMHKATAAVPVNKQAEPADIYGANALFPDNCIQRSIYNATMEAMQAAEEIYGDMPLADYARLMDEIAAEALSRRNTAQERINNGEE